MKLNAWYLGTLPLAFALTRTGFGAQVLVLGITLGIFFGTLALGRRAPGSATSTSPGA